MSQPARVMQMAHTKEEDEERYRGTLDSCRKWIEAEKAKPRSADTPAPVFYIED